MPGMGKVLLWAGRHDTLYVVKEQLKWETSGGVANECL